MEIDVNLFGAKRVATILFLFLGGLAFALTQEPAETSQPQKVQPELNLKALGEPLQDLTSQERKAVDEAIRLIGQRQHSEALASLTSLTQGNAKNSALRVLRAYVLLELGNVAGALDDAKLAEASGVHTAYKCWFLAQVAYLAGNKPLCHREIKHVGADATYGPEAEKLRRLMVSGTK
jgi:hypothetical protein